MSRCICLQSRLMNTVNYCERAAYRLWKLPTNSTLLALGVSYLSFAVCLYSYSDAAYSKMTISEILDWNRCESIICLHLSSFAFIFFYKLSRRSYFIILARLFMPASIPLFASANFPWNARSYLSDEPAYICINYWSASPLEFSVLTALESKMIDSTWSFCRVFLWLPTFFEFCLTSFPFMAEFLNYSWFYEQLPLGVSLKKDCLTELVPISRFRSILVLGGTGLFSSLTVSGVGEGVYSIEPPIWHIS